MSKPVRATKSEPRVLKKETSKEAEELASVFLALQAELADLRKLLKVAAGAAAEPAANK